MAVTGDVYTGNGELGAGGIGVGAVCLMTGKMSLMLSKMLFFFFFFAGGVNGMVGTNGIGRGISIGLIKIGGGVGGSTFGTVLMIPLALLDGVGTVT